MQEFNKVFAHCILACHPLLALPKAHGCVFRNAEHQLSVLRHEAPGLVLKSITFSQKSTKGSSQLAFRHREAPSGAFLTGRLVMALGQEMQVRALRDIPVGEQLHVAYVNLTEDRQTRRQQLMHSKHFVCACERCSEPLETSTDRFLEVRRSKRQCWNRVAKG